MLRLFELLALLLLISLPRRCLLVAVALMHTAMRGHQPVGSAATVTVFSDSARVYYDHADLSHLPAVSFGEVLAHDAVIPVVNAEFFDRDSIYLALNPSLQVDAPWRRLVLPFLPDSQKQQANEVHLRVIERWDNNTAIMHYSSAVKTADHHDNVRAQLLCTMVLLGRS